MLLSARIRLFKNDLESCSEDYCMTEIIDKLEEYENYALELEKQIDDIEKTFSLEAEFKKLRVKKFVYGENNAILFINYDGKYVEYIVEDTCETLGVIYFYENEIKKLLELCEENNVSYDSFRKEFNKVFGKSEVRINGN